MNPTSIMLIACSHPLLFFSIPGIPILGVEEYVIYGYNLRFFLAATFNLRCFYTAEIIEFIAFICFHDELLNRFVVVG